MWPHRSTACSATEIRRHRSTIVFTNNRRSAERITAFLNDEGEIARAHHGSVSLEQRQPIESALKEGRLAAVVATASLELGIDMERGRSRAVRSSAAGQRGRGASSALVGPGTSSARPARAVSFPKMPADLLEQAVLARARWWAGRVEAIRVPIRQLPRLARATPACRDGGDGYLECARSSSRHWSGGRTPLSATLSPQAFETTLEMISGRFRLAATNRGRGRRKR